jgi:hypothetical protein
VVDDAFRDPENRSLECEGGDQLRQRRIALIRLRRSLVVDHGPKPLESLFRSDAGEQAGGNSDRSEEQLHTGGLPAWAGEQTRFASGDLMFGGSGEG